jgi:hypothetical protein
VASPLDNLCGPGKALRKEAPDASELAGLKRSGLTRLADAQKQANSVESRFDLAYNAAHALCLAGLRHAGYRAANRYIVFQVLPHTLGLGPEVWRVLARCHDVRNRGEYEGDLAVDERLLADLIQACKTVAAALDKLPHRPPPPRYAARDPSHWASAPLSQRPRRYARKLEHGRAPHPPRHPRRRAR